MRMKKKNKSRMLPVAVVILLDVLVAELILAGFLLLHPGIIQMAKRQIMPAQSSTAPVKEEMTDDASVMLPEETEPPETRSTETEPTETNPPETQPPETVPPETPEPETDPPASEDPEASTENQP